MTRVAGKTPKSLGSPESWWGERLRATIAAEDELSAAPIITPAEFNDSADIDTW